jgi:hypothetical protein
MPTVGNFAYCISVVTPRGRLLRRRHRRRSRDSCDRSSMCVARLTTLAFSCERTRMNSKQ